jgi:hypothetical protein
MPPVRWLSYAEGGAVEDWATWRGRTSRCPSSLTTAPCGGEGMVEVLEQLLLCHATEELLEEHEG